jgi:hypothetical protein
VLDNPVPATVLAPPAPDGLESPVVANPAAPTTTVKEPEVVTAKLFFLQYPPAAPEDVL